MSVLSCRSPSHPPICPWATLFANVSVQQIPTLSICPPRKEGADDINRTKDHYAIRKQRGLHRKLTKKLLNIHNLHRCGYRGSYDRELLYENGHVDIQQQSLNLGCHRTTASSPGDKAALPPSESQPRAASVGAGASAPPFAPARGDGVGGGVGGGNHQLRKVVSNGPALLRDTASPRQAQLVVAVTVGVVLVGIAQHRLVRRK